MYSNIIAKERRGDYLGQTVQLMPHATDFIKKYITDVSKISVDGRKVPNVCVIELGGTVGDHESGVYLEALSEFSKENPTMFVHVSLLPVVNGDVKTKPTQQSIKTIRSMGIDPDILVLRCTEDIDESMMSKLSRMCKMSSDSIIINRNVSSIYEVPKLFYDRGLVRMMSRYLTESKFLCVPDFSDYNNILRVMRMDLRVVKIAIVGKYTQQQDTYLSLIRAIDHSGFVTQIKPEIVWVDSEDESSVIDKIRETDGVIIPGGFGTRGVSGMLKAAQYCRETDKPLFGICLGMQIMCIELDRNVLGNENATSEEFDGTIDDKLKTVKLSDAKTEMGATMRLGLYTCVLENGSLASEAYGGTTSITERHRHRYEISERFVTDLREYDSANKTVKFNVSGMSLSKRYVEVVESGSLKFWLGCQFHPEFKSRHNTGHPLFVKFMNTIKSLN